MGLEALIHLIHWSLGRRLGFLRLVIVLTKRSCVFWGAWYAWYGVLWNGVVGSYLDTVRAGNLTSSHE